jgi:hypothetical protein
MDAPSATAALRGAMRGSDERVGLQGWPDGLVSFGHASLPSELAPNPRWLLSCGLSLATSPDPRIAPRSAAPHTTEASVPASVPVPVS